MMTNRNKYSNEGISSKRPPGPSGIPFLGSLFKARKNPLDFALNLSRQYGGISWFRIGFYTGYFLNSPEYIRHVLQMNHRNYDKENYNYRKLKPVIGEGLITSSGENWLRQRRSIQPVFHRRRIARFGDMTIKATRDLLNHWNCNNANGQAVDVAAEMMRLTLRIVCKSLFSVDISNAADSIAEAFKPLNEDISYRFQSLLVPPLWIPTPRNRAFKKARDRLNGIVYRIISERRKEGGPQDDLLDMLLSAQDDDSGKGLTDEQLRDEVMTLLLAGHETTANLLTWTWYLLSQNRDAAQKLTQELADVLGGIVPSVEDISALDYLDRVLKESLRLYPPVWIISRRAIHDDHIGGYRIPAGSTVVICSFTMHRHAEFWENPEKFDPDRFLPERVAGQPDYAYFPFGGGPRLCIGNNFAMMEAKLVMATIAQRFRLELAAGHPVEAQPLVTLRSRFGMRMRVEPVHR